MNQKIKSLTRILTKVLMQKITSETGYFSLNFDGKMQFQPYQQWLAFQKEYGEVSLN